MDEDVFDESNLFTTFESVQSNDESKPSFSRTKAIPNGTVSELDSLKNENMLLRRLVRKIGFNPSKDEPLASILYYNGAYSKQAELEDFIRHVIGRSAPKSGVFSYSSPNRKNLLSDGFAAGLGKISDYTKLDQGEFVYDIADLPVGCIQYFSLFCLDKSGSDSESIFPSPPRFDRVYLKTLPEETGSKASQRRKLVCFNCDGDHRLNDCTKRRDLARISMKRREFMETRVNESRYHEDDKKAEQYQHLKPGKVSDGLRKALNMLDHDIPPFVYRMRQLGYPPAWLPGSHDSGIVMYGKEGKEEENDKSDCVDLEYVHFPGFNVPVPRDCRDLAQEFRLPRMQHQHLLDVQPEDYPSWSDVESGKRKHSEDSSGNDSKRIRTSAENDMEIEDEDGPPGSTSIIEIEKSVKNSAAHVSDLEDGEIADSPQQDGMVERASWWMTEPLVMHAKKDKQEITPPPFPLRPLPLHKISQILPGELNHISFEDRSRWLDPIFGNLQVRTGRFDKLKTILGSRENKRKSL